MEIISFLIEMAPAFPFGFLGGMAYYRYRFWKIKRHAPSAKMIGFHVYLSEQDYKNLKNREDDVAYYQGDQ